MAVVGQLRTHYDAATNCTRFDVDGYIVNVSDTMPTTHKMIAAFAKEAQRCGWPSGQTMEYPNEDGQWDLEPWNHVEARLAKISEYTFIKTDQE